jgi:hypothetical protein
VDLCRSRILATVLRVYLRRPEDRASAVMGPNYGFMRASNTSGAAVMTTTHLARLTPNILMNVSMLDAAYQAGENKYLFIFSNTVHPLTNHPVKQNEVINIFSKNTS